MANAEGMTEADASSFDHSSLIRASSFGFRHSAIGNNRRTLNLVSVLSERVSKHLRHIAAVQHDQIRVVRLPFIVLPTFVPPAKSDYCRPPSGEEILQRGFCPGRSVDPAIMQIAAELGDNHRLIGSKLR